jgi:5-methyltetrahydrofolate--homocysteine methyltransferase
LRNQQKKPAGGFNPCLADFIASLGKASGDWLGLFALSVGFGVEVAVEEYHRRNDAYGALLLTGLENALAEAFAEEIHFRMMKEWWECDTVIGTRPAFGYPSCPDHEDKRIVFDLLEAEKRCGMKLTETAMIIPAASVCGLVFASPAAYYFGVGTVGEDQLCDWAKRKGISEEEAKRRIGAFE